LSPQHDEPVIGRYREAHSKHLQVQLEFFVATDVAKKKKLNPRRRSSKTTMVPRRWRRRPPTIHFMEVLIGMP
jgi:hypothetical protein